MSERILVCVHDHGTPLTAEQWEQRIHALATCEVTAGIDIGKSCVDLLRSLAEQRTRVLTVVKMCGDDIIEEQFIAGYWSSSPMERKRSYRKQLALAIAHEITALADRLKRHGIRNPITQAQNEVAQRRGYASGESLHKWLWRNR